MQQKRKINIFFKCKTKKKKKEVSWSANVLGQQRTKSYVVIQILIKENQNENV